MTFMNYFWWVIVPAWVIWFFVLVWILGPPKARRMAEKANPPSENEKRLRKWWHR